MTVGEEETVQDPGRGRVREPGLLTRGAGLHVSVQEPLKVANRAHPKDLQIRKVEHGNRLTLKR